tara:strand:- start:223 stop:894 length:672 start_codon:yes stop_codon:yes gene_type:complete
MKNNGYSVTPLFSKVFYCNNLTDITDESLADIKQFISQQPYFNVATFENTMDYRGSHNVAESTIKHDLLETSTLEPLKQRILDEFRIFKNKVLRTEDLEFGITTSWATRSIPGKEAPFHYHSNCYYSGILYINVAPNSGDICFKDFDSKSYSFDEKVKEWTIFNARTHSWTPENRDIIFFPAEVYHQFLVNKSNIDRYSIAFNLVPLGRVGTEDSEFIYRGIS